MAIFTGAGVAIVTPFQENGAVDYEKLDELIEFHCENGTDSIVICGTSGEAATMTEQEHMECVRFTIERTKGRIPVIAGTGSNCTKTAMELSKEAAGYGADGVLVVTPYYNKATQKGMIAHFTQVAEAAKVPVVLYNIPGRSGCKMEAETVAQLVNHVENIVAIKEASGDFSNIVKMMELTDGKLDIPGMMTRLYHSCHLAEKVLFLCFLMWRQKQPMISVRCIWMATQNKVWNFSFGRCP